MVTPVDLSSQLEQRKKFLRNLLILINKASAQAHQYKSTIDRGSELAQEMATLPGMLRLSEYFLSTHSLWTNLKAIEKYLQIFIKHRDDQDQSSKESMSALSHIAKMLNERSERWRTLSSQLLPTATTVAGNALKGSTLAVASLEDLHSTFIEKCNESFTAIEVDILHRQKEVSSWIPEKDADAVHQLFAELQDWYTLVHDHFENNWTVPFQQVQEDFSGLYTRLDVFNRAFEMHKESQKNAHQANVHKFDELKSEYEALYRKLSPLYKIIGIEIPVATNVASINTFTADHDVQASLVTLQRNVDTLKEYNVDRLQEIADAKQAINAIVDSSPWVLDSNQREQLKITSDVIILPGGSQEVLTSMSEVLASIKISKDVYEAYTKKVAESKTLAQQVNDTIKYINSYGASISPVAAAQDIQVPKNSQQAQSLLDAQVQQTQNLQIALGNYKYIESAIRTSTDILENVQDVQSLTGAIESQTARRVIEESMKTMEENASKKKNTLFAWYLSLRSLIRVKVVEVDHTLLNKHIGNAKAMLQKPTIEIDPTVVTDGNEPLVHKYKPMKVDYLNEFPKQELVNTVCKELQLQYLTCQIARKLLGRLLHFRFCLNLDENRILKTEYLKLIHESKHDGKIYQMGNEIYKMKQQIIENAESNQLNVKVASHLQSAHNGLFTTKASELTKQMEAMNEKTIKLNTMLREIDSFEENLKQLIETNKLLKDIMKLKEREIPKPTNGFTEGLESLKSASASASSLQPIVESLCSQIGIGSILTEHNPGRKEFVNILVRATESHFNTHRDNVSKVKDAEVIKVFQDRFGALTSRANSKASDNYVDFIGCLDKFVHGYLNLFDDMYNVRIMINNRTTFDEERKCMNANAHFLSLYDGGTAQGLVTRDMAFANFKEKPYGPFFKVIYNGSGIDVVRDVDLVTNAFESAGPSHHKPRHYIYAAFGYSGSGKTYTLLSSKESIVKTLADKIAGFAQYTPYYNQRFDVSVRYYDLYGELDDTTCFGNTLLRGDAELEETVLYSEDGMVADQVIWYDYKVGAKNGKNVESLKDEIVQACTLITRTRATNYAEKGEPHKHHIRFTPNNPESSRSHFFVDIKLTWTDTDHVTYTLAKFTILDMGGAENVDHIQKAFFHDNPISSYKVTKMKNDMWKNIGSIQTVLANFIGKADKELARYNKLDLTVEKTKSDAALLQYKPWRKLLEHYQGTNDQQSVKDITTLLQWNNLAALAVSVHEARVGRSAIEDLFIKLFILRKNATRTETTNAMIGLYKGILESDKLNRGGQLLKICFTARAIQETGQEDAPANYFVRALKDNVLQIMFDKIKVFVEIYNEILTGLSALKDLWKEHKVNIQKETPRTREFERCITFIDSPDSTLSTPLIDLLNTKVSENNHLIRKHHCPLRNQGTYINQTLTDIQVWTPTLDKPTDKKPDYKTSIVNILTNDFDTPNVIRKFVLFNNVRLDYAVSTEDQSTLDDETRQNETEYVQAMARTLEFADKVNPFSVNATAAR